MAQVAAEQQGEAAHDGQGGPDHDASAPAGGAGGSGPEAMEKRDGESSL